jgi:4-hydroxybenzoyl-CoA reductase subunit beta
MLRMQPFDVEHPHTVEEATALLEKHGDSAQICAGGTDVVPNMKHGLHEPQVLVHLSRVSDLNSIIDAGAEITIGAMTPLHKIASSSLIQNFVPGLAKAAKAVAGPQLRRMGTIGGNLCLDTRCLYYNQTYFWREALGFCLKKDGSKCHVVESGRKCVAAASNDTATMLLCLDSRVDLQNHAGTRSLPLDAFYVADGVKNTVRQPSEILTRIHIPKGSQQRLEGFAKLRYRQSIDYPMLSVAVRFDLLNEEIQKAQVVVSALAARPKSVKTDFCIGQKLDPQTIAALAEQGRKQCRPLTNICDDPLWRRDMVATYIRKACESALDQPIAT